MRVPSRNGPGQSWDRARSCGETPRARRRDRAATEARCRAPCGSPAPDRSTRPRGAPIAPSRPAPAPDPAPSRSRTRQARRAPSPHAARRNSDRSRSRGGASPSLARTKSRVLPLSNSRARSQVSYASTLAVARRRSRCGSFCVSLTASAPTIFSTTSSCVAKMSVRSRSNRSAQTCPPLPASMSCAVMRTRLPALRMLPSSTKRTPRSRPISCTLTDRPL